MSYTLCGMLWSKAYLFISFRVVTEVKTVRKDGVLRRYKTQYDGKNDLLKWKQSLKIREEAKENNSWHIQAMSLSRSRDIYLDHNNSSRNEEEEVKMHIE